MLTDVLEKKAAHTGAGPAGLLRAPDSRRKKLDNFRVRPEPILSSEGWNSLVQREAPRFPDPGILTE